MPNGTPYLRSNSFWETVEYQGQVDFVRSKSNSTGGWVWEGTARRWYPVIRNTNWGYHSHVRDRSNWHIRAAEIGEGDKNWIVDVQKTGNKLNWWRMRDNWEYWYDIAIGVESGTTYWNNIERWFNTDFDNNGLIAHQNRETEGSVDLLYDDNKGAWINDSANQKTYKVMRWGRQWDDNQLHSWKLSAGEIINGANYVVDVNNANDLYVWEMNDDWNYVRDFKYAKAGSSTWDFIETKFNVDFDNDGSIGAKGLFSVSISSPDIQDAKSVSKAIRLVFELSNSSASDSTFVQNWLDNSSSGIFDVSDLIVSGGEITSFTGSGTTYNATFIPNGDGEKSISVKAGSFVDLAGRAVKASSFSFIHSGNDADGNGLKDAENIYTIVNQSTEITIKDKSGRTYSDNSNRDWNITNAAANGDEWKVLYTGENRNIGKYLVQDVDSSGVLKSDRSSRTRWLSGQVMAENGYEQIFGKDLNNDEIIGVSLVDDNNDGLVDGITSKYQIYDDIYSVDITNSKGRTYSDNSNRDWNITNAAANGDEWKVLYTGENRNIGKYLVRDVDSSGVLKSGPSSSTKWLTGEQMFENGFEDIFNIDFNGDSLIA